MKDKEFNIQVWDIEKIKPYDKNVKNHDEQQVSKIAQSIAEFGWDQPIVVDKEGVIIKGHGRRLAAIKLGIKKVPVWVRDDLSPEAVKASRVADNRVAESSIDTAMLQEELRNLDYDLHGIFDDKELDFLTADLGIINEGVFIEDLESEIAEQSKETESKIDAVDSREVPIIKALGFKSLPARDEKHIVGFMAILEERYNLPAVDAFVAFAKHMVKEYQKE